MEINNLMFTASGIRGIFGKDLTIPVISKIAMAFGQWKAEEKDKRVIIGRDTRPSGKEIEEAIINNLIATGNKVINVGICPTPAIIFAKNKFNIPKAIIISGSHNPPEWNALKLLSTKTFLSNEELKEILDILSRINVSNYKSGLVTEGKSITNLNPLSDYIESLYKYIAIEKIKKQNLHNKLKVVVDTGAGAGRLVTPQIMEALGCKLKVLNNDISENGKFPREIEPIEKNLAGLITEMHSGKYDVGFAHDCDADRLAVVGDDGTCYPEDIGLALLADYYFKKITSTGHRAIFVTNLASSLIFEELAQKYGVKVIRTPVGERYLAEEMINLSNKTQSLAVNSTVFGGEGSCGGIMFPQFNNARDGIFAAVKIVEMLVESKEKISKLVSILPRYYTYREKIDFKNKDIGKIIKSLKNKLLFEGEKPTQIGMDLRVVKGTDWFVLIHPSNTEPIIRIITEAKIESLAKFFCESATNIVKNALEND